MVTERDTHTHRLPAGTGCRVPGGYRTGVKPQDSSEDA